MSPNQPSQPIQQTTPQLQPANESIIARLRDSLQEHPQKWAIGIAAVTAGITLLIYLQGKNKAANTAANGATSDSGTASGNLDTSGGTATQGVVSNDNSAVLAMLSQLQQMFQTFMQQFNNGNGNGNGNGGSGNGNNIQPLPPAQRMYATGGNSLFAPVPAQQGAMTNTLGRDMQWSFGYSGHKSVDTLPRGIASFN